MMNFYKNVIKTNAYVFSPMVVTVPNVLAVHPSVPANTPEPVLARLHADLNKVLNNAEVRKRLDDQGVDARPSTPDELTAFVRAETQRRQHAVKASGATVH